MLWRMPADLRRERIGMMFINIDASRAYTTRSASGRLVHGRQVTGGKGGKGGNLTPARPDRLCSPNPSPIAVRKNSRSLRPAPAQFRVAFRWIGLIRDRLSAQNG